MFEFFLIGIGFLLIIEGFFYFFFTKQIKNMVKLIDTTNLLTIKKIALISVFIGFCLIFFIIKFYKIPF